MNADSLYELSLADARELSQQGTSIGVGLFRGSARDLGDGRILKYGRDVCRAEVVGMQYVRARTSIPIPRPLAYVSDPGRNNSTRKGYLVMEKLPGLRLMDVLGNLDQEQKKTLTSGLKNIVSQLRALDDPSRWGMVGKDGVFHGGYFHYGGVDARCRPCPPHALADIREYFVSSMSSFKRVRYDVGGDLYNGISAAFIEHGSVFSHADLRPENILVDPDTLCIAGIVDWAWAGWYPRSWDHLVAYRAENACSPKASDNWRDIYREVFALHDTEVAAFDLLLRGADEFGLSDRGRKWCKCCSE